MNMVFLRTTPPKVEMIYLTLNFCLFILYNWNIYGKNKTQLLQDIKIVGLCDLKAMCIICCHGNIKHNTTNQKTNYYFFSLLYYQVLTTSHLPSLISIVIDRETTSREAKSLAFGAYRSINLSPALLRRYPPSPRLPSVIRHPAP